MFVAHHDAAHGGLIFAPAADTVLADAFPDWYERQETSPQVMLLVVAGPALAALGALPARPPARLGTVPLARLGGGVRRHRARRSSRAPTTTSPAVAVDARAGAAPARAAR